MSTRFSGARLPDSSIADSTVPVSARTTATAGSGVFSAAAADPLALAHPAAPVAAAVTASAAAIRNSLELLIGILHVNAVDGGMALRGHKGRTHTGTKSRDRRFQRVAGERVGVFVGRQAIADRHRR